MTAATACLVCILLQQTSCDRCYSSIHSGCIRCVCLSRVRCWMCDTTAAARVLSSFTLLLHPPQPYRVTNTCNAIIGSSAIIGCCCHPVNGRSIPPSLSAVCLRRRVSHARQFHDGVRGLSQARPSRIGQMTLSRCSRSQSRALCIRDAKGRLT